VLAVARAVAIFLVAHGGVVAQNAAGDAMNVMLPKQKLNTILDEIDMFSQRSSGSTFPILDNFNR
jgi:hypothetical protein